jgi:hypothetical protein
LAVARLLLFVGRVKHLALLVALVGCVPSPTGDGQKDLDSFSSAVDVDCNNEAMCVIEPHCMTDALRDHRIARYDSMFVIAPSDPNYDVDHMFTYGGGVLDLFESFENGSYGNVSETKCTGITAMPTVGDCWKWEETGCAF